MLTVFVYFAGSAVASLPAMCLVWSCYVVYGPIEFEVLMWCLLVVLLVQANLLFYILTKLDTPPAAHAPAVGAAVAHGQSYRYYASCVLAHWFFEHICLVEHQEVVGGLADHIGNCWCRGVRVRSLLP